MTDPEYHHLRAFSDGVIMSPDVRHRLWRSWGLCERHAWLYFIFECEVRYQPLGTSVLYQDLIGRAAIAIARPAVSDWAKVRRLASRAACPTCDYLAVASRRTEGEPDQRGLARMQSCEASRTIIKGSARYWRSWSCPVCFDGPGLPCRPHLLAQEAEPPASLAADLAELETRIRVSTKAMTVSGPDRTAETDGTLVAVVGWFAGWRTVEILARDR